MRQLKYCLTQINKINSKEVANADEIYRLTLSRLITAVTVMNEA